MATVRMASLRKRNLLGVDKTATNTDPIMLLPRYSLRTSLLGLTTCAVFSLVLGQAVQGRPWAIVVAVAVASLLLLLLFHALLYLISAALSRLVGEQQLDARTSRGGVQSYSDPQSPPSPDRSVVNR